MIKIQGVSKTFFDVTALDAVSIEVAEGQVYGLLGPFGSGKSTLLKIMATLLAADAGRVEIAGLDAGAQDADIRRRIGYKPDFFGVYDDLKVWEYLEFFALAFRLDPRDQERKFNELIRLVGLTDQRDQYVDQLDREMKHRLGLARTLLHDPPVLLLDDPLSGLDPLARQRLDGLLGEIAGQGKTIFMSSNILGDLDRVCDRIGMLNHGKIIGEDSAQAIAERLAPMRTIELKVRENASNARDILRSHRLVSQAETDGQMVIFAFKHSQPDPGELIGELTREGVGVLAYREHGIVFDDAG